MAIEQKWRDCEAAKDSAKIVKVSRRNNKITNSGTKKRKKERKERGKKRAARRARWRRERPEK